MSEVIMPRLSDTMEEGELAKWLKDIGDPVKKGESLAEIETDKATMDLAAPCGGRLGPHLVAAGDVVEVGVTIVTIDDIASFTGNAQASTSPPSSDVLPASANPVTQQDVAAPLSGAPTVDATNGPRLSPRARARARSGGSAGNGA